VLDLHPAEWEVLAEIDGQRPLKAISGGAGAAATSMSAKIVWGLVSTGVVEILEERPVEAPAQTWERPLRDALGEARLALADGQADRARRLLDIWRARIRSGRRCGRSSPRRSGGWGGGRRRSFR
jgi:hypothetical protein